MKEYAGGGGRAKRAKRKHYVDGMSSSDEEGDVLENGLDPEDLYKQKVYPPFFVKEMLGEDVSVEHFQRTGPFWQILRPNSTTNLIKEHPQLDRQIRSPKGRWEKEKEGRDGKEMEK